MFGIRRGGKGEFAIGILCQYGKGHLGDGVARVGSALSVVIRVFAVNIAKRMFVQAHQRDLETVFPRPQRHHIQFFHVCVRCNQTQDFAYARILVRQAAEAVGKRLAVRLFCMPLRDFRIFDLCPPFAG